MSNRMPSKRGEIFGNLMTNILLCIKITYGLLHMLMCVISRNLKVIILYIW